MRQIVRRGPSRDITTEAHMHDHPYDLNRLGALAGDLSNCCGEYISRLAGTGEVPDDVLELLLAVQQHLVQVCAAICFPEEATL
jgi:hypothetical protein